MEEGSWKKEAGGRGGSRMNLIEGGNGIRAERTKVAAARFEPNSGFVLTHGEMREIKRTTGRSEEDR